MHTLRILLNHSIFNISIDFLLLQKKERIILFSSLLRSFPLSCCHCVDTHDACTSIIRIENKNVSCKDVSIDLSWLSLHYDTLYVAERENFLSFSQTPPRIRRHNVSLVSIDLSWLSLHYDTLYVEEFERTKENFLSPPNCIKVMSICPFWPVTSSNSIIEN